MGQRGLGPRGIAGAKSELRLAQSHPRRRYPFAELLRRRLQLLRVHGHEHLLDLVVDPSGSLFVGLVGSDPGEPAELGRGLAVLRGQIGQEPMGLTALLAPEHRESDLGRGAVGRRRVAAGALESGELDSGHIAAVALRMASDHPGEVLERIALSPILQCQLRETQGRIVGEMTARVAVDEGLEGFDAAGAIRTEDGEGPGVLLLLLGGEIRRDGPPHSPAAEEEQRSKERDEARS